MKTYHFTVKFKVNVVVTENSEEIAIIEALGNIDEGDVIDVQYEGNSNEDDFEYDRWKDENN